MRSETYYYYVDARGETEGPVSYTQLQGMLHAGSIKPTTQICKVGDSHWAPLLPDVGDPGRPSVPNEPSYSVSLQSIIPSWIGVAIWIIALGIFLNVGILIFSKIPLSKTWEYRVLEFSGEGVNDRFPRAMALDLEKLQSAGRSGWEVVGQWVEHETVFPNFGKDEYVTGIQPNFRTAKICFLLKRKLSRIYDNK